MEKVLVGYVKDSVSKKGKTYSRICLADTVKDQVGKMYDTYLCFDNGSSDYQRFVSYLDPKYLNKPFDVFLNNGFISGLVPINN